MTSKLNCWQFKNCGREKGGLMAEIAGECPVATAMKYDGLNGGVGAGRACWMVTGSGCRMNPSACQHTGLCHNCEFYKRVIFEQQEHARFVFNSIRI